MHIRMILCLALIAPLAGGCKALVAKTVLRLAVGPEQAEKLDPVVQTRRKILDGLQAPRGAKLEESERPHPVP